FRTLSIARFRIYFANEPIFCSAAALSRASDLVSRPPLLAGNSHAGSRKSVERSASAIAVFMISQRLNPGHRKLTSHEAARPRTSLPGCLKGSNDVEHEETARVAVPSL